MSNATREGRFAYDGLDRIVHEKARLGILTSLCTRPEGLLFSDLKRLCALTDGNLNRHLEVLHGAALVEIWKRFEGRRPQTLVRLTPEGKRKFLAYLRELERVLRDAHDAQEALARSQAGGAPLNAGPNKVQWSPA